MYDLCPRIAWEKYARHDLERIAALGFRGLHYVDVLSIVPPRRCFADAHRLTRREAAVYVNRMLGHGARLMVAHVSTAAELEEIARHANVKAECCTSYLTFCCQDYARLGALIKCNPAIKNESDRLALRQALGNGGVYCIATDHAPHEMAVKQGGAFKAASGMPSVQFSLTMMLQMADEGWLTLPRVAELMCHHPATYFGVQQRGFIRRGMKADLVIVRHLDEPHAVTNKDVVSKCGWTPYSGMQTRWQVEQTICNGVTVFRLGGLTAAKRAAQQVIFRHDA